MMKAAKLIPVDTPLDKAEELRRVDDPFDFKLAVLAEQEIMGMNIPDKAWVMRNFMREETITIVNGFRGEGKSWLSTSIGNEVSWGGRVGPWKVEKPMNVLIVDGEMPVKMQQERLGLLNKGRDIRKKPRRLFVYPEAYAYRIGLHRANILSPEWRERIADVVYGRRVGLLILDNLSSLAPGIDENDKMEFDPVNRWLLEMRFNGITILMTHHTGKSGQQRGTSAHEDHVDVSILLSRPRGWNQGQGCRFKCEAIKDRALALGGETTTLELADGRAGSLSLEEVDISTNRVAEDLFKRYPLMTEKEALDRWGIKKTTFYAVKKRMANGEGT